MPHTKRHDSVFNVRVRGKRLQGGIEGKGAIIWLALAGNIIEYCLSYNQASTLGRGRGHFLILDLSK